MLASISAAEGQLVQEGAESARLDDRQAQLLQQKAQAELDVARKEAASEVEVRVAAEAATYAAAELNRAKEAKQRLSQSISQSELDRLHFEVQRTSLEQEQARQKQEIAKLRELVKQAECEIAVASRPTAQHRGPADRHGRQTLSASRRMGPAGRQGVSHRALGPAAGGGVRGCRQRPRDAHRPPGHADRRSARTAPDPVFRHRHVRGPGDRSCQPSDSDLGRDRQPWAATATGNAGRDVHRHGRSGEGPRHDSGAVIAPRGSRIM